MAIINIRIPAAYQGASSLRYKALEKIQEMLSAVSINILRKDKLVTSSFRQEMTLRGGYSLGTVLSRLSKILDRNTVKAAPYLKHSVHHSLEPIVVSNSATGTSLRMRGFASSMTPVLLRYCRYVSYIARKHAVPLQAEHMIYTAGGVVALRVVASVPINGVTVSWAGDVRPGEAGPPYRILGDNYEDWFNEAKESAEAAGLSEDAVFSNQHIWRGVNPGTDSTANTLPGAEHRLAYERVFFHLKQIIASTIVLSRKLTYDVEAFTSRPAAGS